MTSVNDLSTSSDLERKIDIENHSGGIWKCIGKRESTYGGHIYEFVPYEEFDNWAPHLDLGSRFQKLVKKTMEMYPAIELSPLDIWPLCKDRSVIDLTLSGSFQRQFIFLTDILPGVETNKILEQIERDRSTVEEKINNNWTSIEKMREDMAEIGYCVLLGSDNLLHLELPDLEALQNNWKHFQETHSDKIYPDLDVLSSEGIASDLDFFHAYKEHNALLSNSKEFVHDHLLHVKTRIVRMFAGKEHYDREKNRIIDLIDRCRTTINTAIEREREQNGESGILYRDREKLNFIIGMLTDAYFSYDLDDMIDSLNFDRIEVMLSSSLALKMQSVVWNNYLEKRFGPETNFESIQKLWKEVRTYVSYLEV